MKRTFAICLLAFLGIGTAAAQTGEDLFRQAILKERSEGDLHAAIDLYERIAVEYAAERDVTARALVQLGKAYERMGESRARSAYERVVSDYADQAEMAAEAKRRLSVLDAGTGKDVEKGLVVRKIVSIDAMGRPSPDGRYLSYVNWKFGNLALYDLQTGERRDLTDEGTWDGGAQFSDVSIWSPDGREVAYFWIYGQNADLRIVDVETGKSRVLVKGDETGTPWPVDWSEDGRYILAINEKIMDDGKHHVDGIVLVDVHDGSIKTVKQLTDGLHSASMSFSPDGRFIAYEAKDGNEDGRDIRIVSTDGRHDDVLVDHFADDLGMRWTLDGKGIIFVSNRSGQNDLWYQAVTDGMPAGEPRLIRQGVGEHFHPMDFTADGTLFFGSKRSTFNLYSVDLDVNRKRIGKPARIDARYEGSNQFPFFSPDGKKIAFLSDREANSGRLIVIRDVASGEEQELEVNLGRFEQPHGWPDWLADGKTLLIHGLGEEGRGLYGVDVESGSARHITAGDILWQSAHPDGRRVFFVDGQTRLVQFDLSSGERTELEVGQRLKYRLAVSPDGTKLAYFEGDNKTDPNWQRDLVVLDLESGTSAIIWTGDEKEAFGWSTGLDWLPDSRTLLLGRYARPDRMHQLYFVDVKSEERTPIGAPMKAGEHMMNMRVSPDGTTVIFGRGRTESEIWTMENLFAGE